MAVRRHGLVRARKAAGFTQESFAEAAHVERSTVVRWEAGTREPLPHQRPKLARLLKVGMAELDVLLSPPAPTPTPAPDLTGTVVRAGITFRTVSEAFRVVDRKVGGGVLYGQVVRFLQDEVAPKLLAPPPGTTHHEVFSAAASFSEFAGWAAHDSGRDAQAKAHLTQACHLAAAAENPALRANVLASLSHLAVQLDDAENAERLALAGVEQLSDGRAGLSQLRARLHAMHGRALAKRGHERAALVALDAGETALAAAEQDVSADWLSGFDRASFAAEVALCMYDLGRYGEAAESAAEAIELRGSSDRVRSRVFASVTLANALAALGDHAGAARIGTEVIVAVSELQSMRAHAGLARLGERLAEQSAVPQVVEMNDLLAASAVHATDQVGWPA